MKLTVSFFDRGPSCPTDRARSLFFGFVLLLFNFLFLVSFVFARAWLHNNPAKVFPCGQVSTFSLLSLPFLSSNDCISPVLPLHPLRKSRAGFEGSSSTTISSQRCLHTRSPSSDPRLAEVFMIIFCNLDDLHNVKFPKVLSINQHWVAQSKGYRLTACSWFPFYAEKETKK